MINWYICCFQIWWFRGPESDALLCTIELIHFHAHNACTVYMVRMQHVRVAAPCAHVHGARAPCRVSLASVQARSGVSVISVWEQSTGLEFTRRRKRVCLVMWIFRTRMNSLFKEREPRVGPHEAIRVALVSHSVMIKPFSLQVQS